MALRKSKGNMYEWVTHTWNPIKGACPHDCSYCYMKRWGKLNPVHLDEKELRIDLGENNFIFIGSSTDMWANDVPSGWINKILEYCTRFNNQYLVQTKNPRRFSEFWHDHLHLEKFSLCTTIETNRHYLFAMGQAPHPKHRAKEIGSFEGTKLVTIEPIMDFDTTELVDLIKLIRPKQVNIGADSGGHNLPEPEPDKIQTLMNELHAFTVVKPKKNLKRLLHE